LPIADFRLLISGLIKSAIGNRQLAMI
jgi:hypothetical protein